jgi:hypothetical protein
MRPELYEKQLTRDEYVTTLRKKEGAIIPPEFEELMYQKYLVRYGVFTRDSFKCQNKECRSPHCHLTLHHLKAQRNGGEDTVRNLVTLCDDCHKRYETARGPLVFPKEAMWLPKTARGLTFRLQRSANRAAEWKRVKKLLKKFRKILRREGFKLSLKEYIEDKNVAFIV